MPTTLAVEVAAAEAETARAQALSVVSAEPMAELSDPDPDPTAAGAISMAISPAAGLGDAVELVALGVIHMAATPLLLASVPPDSFDQAAQLCSGASSSEPATDKTHHAIKVLAGACPGQIITALAIAGSSACDWEYEQLRDNFCKEYPQLQAERFGDLDELRAWLSARSVTVMEREQAQVHVQVPHSHIEPQSETPAGAEPYGGTYRTCLD
eukprot:SAG22_NODE_4545_length_1239_cov_1.013158_1_plen_211_part_10